MTLSFTTAKKRTAKKAIEFSIDDQVFKFKPPKMTGLYLMALEASDYAEGSDELDAAITQLNLGQLEWFWAGLTDKDTKAIKARLYDPRDDLDTDTIYQLISGLMEAASGRPT